MKEKMRLLLPPIFFKLHLIPLYLKDKILYRKNLLYDELSKQIAEIPEIAKLFPEEKMKQHYVHEPHRHTIKNPDIYVNQLRFYWYYKYFKKHHPNMFDKNTSVLDVGATSGIFLESINKKGTALNINKECVDFLNKKGIKAIQGNAENINLPDKSFDYAVSFQCLEHLPNPLMALNEIGRIAKKKVFISVPYTEKTKIYDMDYGIKIKKESWKVKGDVEIGDVHIFEFSTEDLKKLSSYTNLEYENSFPILYFDNNTPYRRNYNKFYVSYFSFFILKPKNKKNSKQ